MRFLKMYFFLIYLFIWPLWIAATYNAQTNFKSWKVIVFWFLKSYKGNLLDPITWRAHPPVMRDDRIWSFNEPVSLKLVVFHLEKQLKF